MSKRTERDAVVIGGEPRVNLLPPEVALRKKARSARRGLVALVIIVPCCSPSPAATGSQPFAL